MRTGATAINDLKREVFYRLLETAGRVFILVRYSEDVEIGRRGFLPEEVENGLVLVFNRRMRYSWDDFYLKANLNFGTAVERCCIPSDAITAVYSPELGTQLVITPTSGEGDTDGEDSDGMVVRSSAGEKVIKVDFKKRR